MTGGVLPYVVALATMMAIQAVAALGLSLQFGMAGLFNVGCAAFFAAGAYASAIVTGPHFSVGLGGFGLPLPLGLLAALAVSALLGLVVAGLVLRLEGDTLAIASFGLAVAVQIACVNASGITGGPGGLSGIPLPLRDSLRPNGALAWLTVCIGIALIAYGLLQRLDAAPWGRALRAAGEDPEAAAAMGKDVARFRLQAFVAGSALMGLAGGLYAQNAGFIGPQDFLPMFTFQLYAMVIIGGVGNHAGALLGTCVVWALWSGSGQVLGGLLPASLQAKVGALRVILIAVVLLGILLLRPAGLLPERVGSAQRDKPGLPTRRGAV